MFWKIIVCLIAIIVGICWLNFLQEHDRTDNEYTDDQMGL